MIKYSIIPLSFILSVGSLYGRTSFVSTWTQQPMKDDEIEAKLMSLYRDKKNPAKQRIMEIVQLGVTREGRYSPVGHQLFRGDPRWWRFLKPLVDPVRHGSLDFYNRDIDMSFLAGWERQGCCDEFRKHLEKLGYMDGMFFTNKGKISERDRLAIVEYVKELLKKIPD
jgi:hypothetical protein